MNRNAQAIVLTAIGAVALRVGATDEHAQYVNSWMQWPLVVSGVLLIALAFTRAFERAGTGEEHRASPAVWALLLPVVVAFVVQPTALGAYSADRRVNEVGAASYDEAAVALFSSDQANDVLVSEFVALAWSYPEALADNEFRLVGFVTRKGGDWFVTRLTITCCAADAAGFRVRVAGADAPAEGEWVEVVGRWVAGTGQGDDPEEPPTLSVSRVEGVPAPKRPYE